MARVLVAGIAVVDFLFQLDEVPSEARKYWSKDAQIVGGGIAANAAVAIARLGGEAWLATRLGDDAIGDMIADDLEREGVDLSLTKRSSGGRSSFSAVVVDRNGERQIVNYRGDGLAETAPDPGAVTFDAVLVDTRWQAGALAALQLARSQGIPGVLDGEAPIDADLLQTASHVALSRTGLASLADGPLTDALSKVQTDAWLCVTDGANGVTIRDSSHVPAHTVRAVDTLGAGDVWHGAFALALAEGQTEIAAARWASAAAALKCMTPGGRKGAPNRETLAKFLKENSQ